MTISVFITSILSIFYNYLFQNHIIYPTVSRNVHEMAVRTKVISVKRDIQPSTSAYRQKPSVTQQDSNNGSVQAKPNGRVTPKMEPQPKFQFKWGSASYHEFLMVFTCLPLFVGCKSSHGWEIGVYTKFPPFNRVQIKEWLENGVFTKFPPYRLQIKSFAQTSTIE